MVATTIVKVDRDSTILRFGPPAIASAILAYILATHTLPNVARGIGLFAAMVAWSAAAIMRRRDVRSHGTAVTSIAAAICAGQTHGGIVYEVGVALLILTCLLSMHASRIAPNASSSSSSSASDFDATKRTRSLATLALVSAVIITGTLIGLPILARRVEARFEAMFGSGDEDATAFSSSMTLGSTRGMLQSDTIVMHIDGERPEYLRGAVYDEYNGRFWRMSPPGHRRRTITTSRSVDDSPTRITLVRGAVAGEDMRWFLPADTCNLSIADGKLQIDGFGVARRSISAEDPPRIGYASGAACKAPEATIAQPTVEDTYVDPQLARTLQPLAAQWIAASNAQTDRQKLAAIDHELSKFEYSLAVARDRKLDPIVDFVTLHRAGHCEMFASAMVLMARTQGIPARVVGGYHVSEVNPITGRAVVRDRNAHAWVEAWVEGTWRGYDPTPGSEIGRNKAGFMDHVGDLISTGLEKLAVLLTKVGTLGQAGVLAAIAGLLVLIRWIGQRLTTRRQRQQRLKSGALPPLPCFDALIDALTGAGIARDESEPVEAFARRLAKTEAPWSKAVSDALLDYTRLRYGDIGDEKVIVRMVDSATRAVRTTATS